MDDDAEAGPPADSRTSSVNRREFLSGAGASLVLQGVAFAADEPNFVPQDGGYVVSHAGKSWTVAPGMFDRASRGTSVEYRDDGAAKRLKLSNAVYPGTDFPADFEATFYSREGEWYVRLEVLTCGKLIELPLKAWMTPPADPMAVPYSAALRRRRIDLGRGGSLTELDGRRLTLWSDFSGHLSTNGGGFVLYRVGERERQLNIRSAGLDFRLDLLSPARPPKSSQFTLHGPSVVPDEMWLGQIGAAIQVKASVFSPRVTIQSFHDRGARNADVVIDADEASLNLHSGAVGPNGARIQLENARLQFEGRTLSEHLILQASISRRDGGLGFETKFFSSVIEGDPSEIVKIDFGARQLPSLSIKTKLIAAHVPIEADANADVAFAPATSCEILVMPHTHFPPPKDKCRPCDAFIWIGERDAGMQVPLEPGRLRLRRSDDLLDLSFGFLHHALQCDHSGTRIEQRWAFLDGCNTLDRNSPRVIVHFAPQHVFEEAFLPPFPDQSPAAPAGTGKDACNVTPPVPRGPISGADLARTRISGPTRLVFEEKNGLHPEKREPHEAARHLTVDYLTDWADLAMVVNKRALPRNTTLEDQLGNVGIDQSTSRLDARARVTAQAQPPGKDETSIEAVYRLLLSPDNRARWKTPRRTLKAGRTPEVWAARLDNPDETAMRAIFARQMDIGFLTGKQGAPPPPRVAEFVGSLNEDDRRQIAALTSFYGLAALRRIIVSKDGRTAGDDPSGMVFLPNKKYAYLDATDYKRSPGGDPGQEPDPNDELSALPQEGVVFAKPFERFNLTLSRSATVDALWRGEPPAPLTLATPEDPFFFPAFTIERYLHRIRDGRDAFVEVTYKGFLFPLGHRAALLKVTRREFHPYRNADQTRPIAYLIQHLYIVCRKPLKTFRAFNQPFGSYDFPPTSIDLKTTQTPDLADPALPDCFPLKNGADKCRPVPANGRDAPQLGVFWPTLLNPNADGNKPNPGGEVMFEYAIDGHDKLARSPLLFVDNAAAHSPLTMAWVTKYYNEFIGEAKLLPSLGADGDPRAYLRVVDHGGAPRRYAAEQKDGQCTFDTSSWVLAARGLVRSEKSAGEIQDFHMDAFMEGRDQPPFYPIVKRAAINVQPINRLIGRKESPIAVDFNPRYVRSGFDPVRNPSEIYLNVLEPRIYLDASADGQSTGAVAKPNAQLAALSRKIGPVGGRLPDPVRGDPKCNAAALAVGAAPPEPGPQPVGVVEPATSPVASALGGNFNPLEYFVGAASEARLLGIIPLKDILKAVLIEAAPKLVEKAQYLTNEAAEEIATQLESLRTALAKGLKTLDENVGSTLKKIKDDLVRLGGADADPAALYPGLWSALQSVATTIGDVRKVVEDENSDLAALSAAAGRLVAQVNRLLAEVQAVARDPMPANVRDVIAKVKDYWNRIQSIVDDRKQIVQFVDDFEDLAFHKICEAAVETEVFESVFGPLHLESNPSNPIMFPAPRPQNRATKAEMQHACEQLLRDPKGTLPRLQEALFYEAFSEPLVRAIDEFRAFKAQVSGKISQALQYSRRALADRIAIILRLKTENAELDAIAIAAYTIAGAIVEQLQSLADADLAPDKVKNAIDAKIAIVNATITEQVEVVKKTAGSEATNLEVKVTDRVNKAQQALKAQDPDLYYFLTSEQQKFATRAAALKLLSAKLAQLDTPKKLQDAIGADLNQAVQLLIGPAIEDARTAMVENARANAAGWTRRVMGLANTLLTQALNTAFAVVMTEAAKTVDQWCGSASPTANKLIRVLQGLVADAVGPVAATEAKLREFEGKLRSLTVAVAQLNVPATAEPMRLQLSQLLTAIATNNQSLIAMIDEFERVRNQLDASSDTWKNLCGPQVSGSISTIAHAVDMRRRIAEMLATAIGNITSALTSAVGLAAPARALAGTDDIKRQLTELLSQIVGMAGSITSISYLAAPVSDVDTAIGEFGGKVITVGDAWKELKKTAGRIKTDIDQAKKDIDDTARSVEEKVRAAIDLGRSLIGFARQDRRFVATLVQNCFAGTALETNLNTTVRAGLSRLIDLLTWVNGTVLGVVQEISDQFGAPRDASGPTQPVALALASIVPANTIRDLGRLIDALKADQAELKGIKDELAKPGAGIATTVDLTRSLQQRWRDNTPAVVSTVQFVEQILDAIASGNIQSLIDVSALERELRDAIVDLIPARVSLSYDFDAELPNFPSGDPIFAIDSDSQYYDPGTGNDLVIASRVELNVLTGTRSVNARGTVRPFKIHLLGSGLDLITLKFKGADFSYDPQSGTNFKADIAGFKIGAALQFLSALASLGSGGNKSDKKDGFYYEYSVLPPEVEVGYRFNKPLLLVGSLTFQNIGFAISAHLPFDYRQVEFRASFATREKPFLVSQPTPIPLGGGGFVGLRASARGIVAFEISLEFGAICAIDLGVLSGSGRITVGMYLLSYQDGGRRFEGFMHAVGEGHIVCFGLSFLIEVRTVQSGSSMEGSATYSFSFEVMRFEVTYSLTAHSKTQGGGGGANAMMRDSHATSASTKAANALAAADPKARNVRSLVPPKMQDWKGYASHFHI